MTYILVDSSVWIDYFRGGKLFDAKFIDAIIDSNQICTNDLILSELLPSIEAKKERRLGRLLYQLHKIPLKIVWPEIIALQIKNIKAGLGHVGIPDLIILQNTIQNKLELCALDGHFLQLQKLHDFVLHQR